MPGTRTLVALISLLFVASAALAWWWHHEAAPPESDFLRQGTPADVRAAVLAEPTPQLTVVNFWASWCEPCKREFPTFLRLRREFAARGVRVIFVSIDDGSDFAEAEGFLREHGVDVPSFYKGTQSLNFVAELFPGWTGAVPATLLLAPDGAVLESWEGDTTWDELAKKVRHRLGDS